MESALWAPHSGSENSPRKKSSWGVVKSEREFRGLGTGGAGVAARLGCLTLQGGGGMAPPVSGMRDGCVPLGTFSLKIGGKGVKEAVETGSWAPLGGPCIDSPGRAAAVSGEGEMARGPDFVVHLAVAEFLSVGTDEEESLLAC